jgi:glutathione S-transferase
MIDLYYWTTPNGHKITLFLEEAGIEYAVKPVNIGKGEQFDPAFLALSPNNRIPAIVDHDPADGGEPVSVFESGAILLYLAGKTGKFIPKDLRGQDIEDFPNLKRWREAIRARPATARAYALVKKVNPNAGGIRTEEERKVLFGQDRSVVK